MIEPVVRHYRLWEAPEFQKQDYPKGWTWQTAKARLSEIWRDIRGMWGTDGVAENSSGAQPMVDPQPGDTNPPTQAQVDAAVSTYSGYIFAVNDGKSNTIRVTYRAWTPERAAAIVNAHLDSYRNLEVQAKVGGGRAC